MKCRPGIPGEVECRLVVMIQEGREKRKDRPRHTVESVELPSKVKANLPKAFSVSFFGWHCAKLHE